MASGTCTCSTLSVITTARPKIKKRENLLVIFCHFNAPVGLLLVWSCRLSVMLRQLQLKLRQLKMNSSSLSEKSPTTFRITRHGMSHSRADEQRVACSSRLVVFAHVLCLTPWNRRRHYRSTLLPLARRGDDGQNGVAASALADEFETVRETVLLLSNFPSP